MVRLAVVPSGVLCTQRRSRGGAKQLYGVRPARPSPGERTAAMSHAAPQKPLRAVRRLVKATGSILAVTVAFREPAGNRDPVKSVGDFRSTSRIVPVSAWLGVRAASCGRWFNGFAMLDGSLIRDAFVTGSAARGPIQNRRGRVFDAREPVRDRCPRFSSSASRSPWRAPVRQTAPRAGPVVASVNQHGFIGYPHRLRAARCINEFGRIHSLSRTCLLSFLPFEAVLVLGFPSLPRRGCIP